MPVRGPEWQRSIFDWYTLGGAVALRDALARWQGGRLVVHVTELPIECAVGAAGVRLPRRRVPAPARAARSRRAGLRHAALRAFTKPIASARLGGMLEEERGIALETDFMVERVEPESRTPVSYDEREIPYGLLVTDPGEHGRRLRGA